MKTSLGLVIFLLVNLNGFSQDKVVLTTHNQEPLSFINANGKVDGIAVKPVVYALEKMGWKYEFLVVPWARAQEMAKSKESHGFFAGSRNKERDEMYVASAPIADQKWNWYLLKESPLNPKSPDFKKMAKVGGYIGSNMLAWLKSNSFQIAGEPVDPNQLFLMLSAKRMDACLANEYNFDNFLKINQNFKGKFRFVTEQSNLLYVFFNKDFIKKNPSFLPLFNWYVKQFSE